MDKMNFMKCGQVDIGLPLIASFVDEIAGEYLCIYECDGKYICEHLYHTVPEYSEFTKIESVLKKYPWLKYEDGKFKEVINGN